MTIRALSALALALGVAATATAQSLESQPIQQTGLSVSDQKIKFAGQRKAQINNAGTEALHAAISLKGIAAEEKAWAENFNGGKMPAGWTADATDYVTWTIRDMSSSHQFTDIDADDKGSLYVDGPYQVYRRETSSVTTTSIAVPANASLQAYIGYTLNMDEYCRLSISVSDDGFATSKTLWTSNEGTGTNTWMWRPVNVDLAEWAGRSVQLRLTYGPGSKDSFNTGGYMGDFAIDNLAVVTPGEIGTIEVLTGDRIDFVDASRGDVVKRLWSFPGAVPETSSERNPTVYYTADGKYDVSLTVYDADGNSSAVTMPALVEVTGTQPVAHIGLPATFRYSATRLPMIAPLVPVTFTDASEGFPTEQAWVFSGVDTDGSKIFETDGPEATVSYAFLHKQTVGLAVGNSHGTSTDLCDVSVEYSGTITNFRPDDKATVFDLDGYGEFPGTNSMKITAYAEKFSKPSRPIVVEGAYVYFTQAKADELIEQIASIGVHLYTSVNGLPGERIDSDWWTTVDLDLPSSSGELVGTAFKFGKPHVIDDEFFIVVDGIPEKSETCTISFALADFRADGNTAYMLRDGKWVDVSTWFPAGKNHTSYLIQPYVTHSVMAPSTIGAPAELEFGAAGGTKPFSIFSIRGYNETVDVAHDWCRVTSKPNGMTVDELMIQCDPLPEGIQERETTVSPTDGATRLDITVRQKRGSGVSDVAVSTDVMTVDGLTVSAVNGVSLYTLQGVAVAHGNTVTAPAAGLYIAISNSTARKVMLK